MTDSRELALLEEIEELRAVNQALRQSTSKTQQLPVWLRWLRPRNMIVLMMVGLVTLGMLRVREERRVRAAQIARITADKSRAIPMLAAPLEPGTVIRSEDVGLGLWPTDEIVGDILLSEKHIVGRIVVGTIEPATPIRARHLRRVPDAPPTDD